jgi:hypothetical protein
MSEIDDWESEDVEFEFSRVFDAVWSAVGESADGLAHKVQEIIRRLAAIDPAYGELRPSTSSGELLYSDQPTVLQMTVPEFGSVIGEHMGRHPHALNAPADRDGFVMFMDSGLPVSDPRKLGASIGGGDDRRLPRTQHHVELSLTLQSPVWRERALALPILDTLLDVEGCEWASASTIFTDVEHYFRPPWMRWAADTSRPIPALFQLDDAPLPTQREAYRGGELSTWSWESVKQSVGRRMVCFGYD